MKLVKTGMVVVLASMFWAGLAFTALDRGWGHAPLIQTQFASEFVLASRQLAEQRSAGNVSCILLEGGLPTHQAKSVA